MIFLNHVYGKCFFTYKLNNSNQTKNNWKTLIWRTKKSTFWPILTWKTKIWDILTKKLTNLDKNWNTSIWKTKIFTHFYLKTEQFWSEQPKSQHFDQFWTQKPKFDTFWRKNWQIWIKTEMFWPEKPKFWHIFTLKLKKFDLNNQKVIILTNFDVKNHNLTHFDEKTDKFA